MMLIRKSMAKQHPSLSLLCAHVHVSREKLQDTKSDETLQYR